MYAEWERIIFLQRETSYNQRVGLLTILRYLKMRLRV